MEKTQARKVDFWKKQRRDEGLHQRRVSRAYLLVLWQQKRHKSIGIVSLKWRKGLGAMDAGHTTMNPKVGNVDVCRSSQESKFLIRWEAEWRRPKFDTGPAKTVYGQRVRQIDHRPDKLVSAL